ncbi:hypothetical protein V7S76_01555 [Aquirufa sp. ROCK2-A2]
MRIKQLVIILLSFISFLTKGQDDSKTKIYPIEEVRSIFDSRYVYKRQIIDSPSALQIPLLDAKDPEVSYEFLTFKKQRKTMGWVSGISTAVALYSFLNKDKVSDGFYWSVFGGTALFNIYLGTASMKHFNKALNRYNELAKTNQQVTLKINPIGPLGPNLGLAWNYQF